MPRLKTGRVTLRNIAERAHVSAMTVSRVLSGKDGLVKPATARKIRRIASELNYRPNISRPSALPTVVVMAECISAHHYLAQLVDGMARAVEERKYGVIVCQSVGGLAAALEQFPLSGVAAIAPPESFFYGESGLPAPSLKPDVPLVVIHCAMEQNQFHEISPDIEAMAHQSAEHLLALGHRYLGYLGGPTPELEPHWFELRRRGILRALEAYDLPISRLQVQPTADAVVAEAACMQLLRRSPRTTGLICINDEVAVAAISGVQKLDMRVPQDVSVVGCNDVPWVRFFSPRLTTIAIDMRSLIESGINLLFDLMHGRLPDSVQSPVKVRLATQLVARESTGPRKA